jgi:hypothetical protein
MKHQLQFLSTPHNQGSSMSSDIDYKCPGRVESYLNKCHLWYSFCLKLNIMSQNCQHLYFLNVQTPSHNRESPLLPAKYYLTIAM